jgi:hypothetical protein
MRCSLPTTSVSVAAHWLLLMKPCIGVALQLSQNHDGQGQQDTEQDRVLQQEEDQAWMMTAELFEVGSGSAERGYVVPLLA